MVEHLIHTYAFNLEHIKKIVADVSDEQMTLQPNGLVNLDDRSFGERVRHVGKDPWSGIDLSRGVERSLQNWWHTEW